MNINALDLAWMKGEGSYVKGDTVEDAVRKAEEQGYIPGSQAHSAFLGGFFNMIKGEAPPDKKIAPEPAHQERKRYSLPELLEGVTQEKMDELLKETSWANEGGPTGREIL